MLVENFFTEREVQQCIQKIKGKGLGQEFSIGQGGDDIQITNDGTRSWYGFFPGFHRLLEPRVSEVFKTPLIKTNDFGRIYTKGAELEKHIDGPHCDYSFTINLINRPHTERWAFHAGDDTVYMSPGDAYFYRGPQVTHWRDELQYDECWQWFFHFNEAD